tara:strand:- start:44 stop:253 length:210 start_codon:yes stop_codon:yes gene_type:complete
MPRFNNINGTKVQFTAAEETARDAEETQAVIDQKIIDDAKADAITKKTSAVAKLKALGLTDAEIGALKI